MPAPYNYTELVGGFQSPQEAFINTIKLRQASIEADKKKQTDAQMKLDLADYMQSPSPQKLANLHIKYPAIKDSLDNYTKVLTDADKKTTLDFASQAFGLNRAGKTDDVVALFDQYITGANNGGRTDIARALTDAKKTYLSIDDPKAREALLGSVMAGTGKDGLDLYEKVWSTKEAGDTPFIKELVAEGLEPGTPEFKAALQKKREGDPFVVVPFIGLYLKKDVLSAAGDTRIAPVVPQAAIDYLKANPDTRDAFDQKYGKGTADRILGGGGSNTTSNFR